MSAYKLGVGCIIRQADGACIGIDPGNADYQAYLEWREDGNTPDPEFTAKELKANTAADKEATARADFAERDFEERFLASPEKASLK